MTENTKSQNDQGNLAELATKIKDEHQLCRKNAYGVVRHAIKAGNLLLKAKEVCGHGKFLDWVERTCDVSERHAQRYMLLAKHSKMFAGANSQHGEYLSLRGALASLSEEAKKAEAKESRENWNDLSGDEPEEELAQPVAEHLRRVKEVKRLTRRRKVWKPVEKDLFDRVNAEARSFAKRVVALAREYGKRLSVQPFAEQGYDQDLVAMLLLKLAEQRLKFAEALAPPHKKGTMPPPEW